MAGQSFGKSHCEFRPNQTQIARLDAGSYVEFLTNIPYLSLL
jgi:hypothetical protein